MAYQLFAALLMPLPVSVLLGLSALVLAGFKKLRAAVVAGVLSLLVLWAFSTPVVAGRLAAPLERRFPPVPVAASPVAPAIVVLGGSLGSALPPRQGAELVDASDRLLHAARLQRAGKAPILVACGGRVPSSATLRPESDEMVGLLVEWGVPREAIQLEGGSRTTAENAAGAKRILWPKGIRTVLLVTSALHMPRAVAVFERAGFTVLPSPTDFAVTRAEPGLPPSWVRAAGAFLPEPGALALSHDALHERLGLLWYRLRGWV